MQLGACFTPAGEQDSQASIAEQQAVTPDNSFSVCTIRAGQDQEHS